MTPDQITNARADMAAYVQSHPLTTATQLAEYAALEQNHEEWLDDPDHEIWHLALEFVNDG